LKKVVIDTNVLLVSISDRSKLHWVFEYLIAKKYYLCVTADILAEYAEVIERFMGVEASERIMGVIENLENIQYVTSYYKFHLFTDEDDNKFVDCAIAVNADYIVSHDKDFNLLKTVKFPSILVIDTTTFKTDLENNI
jgi:putative PIN family toxin of toxin-antitoxin system